MSTAAELRFRVQAPNSEPRVTAVIALDPPGERFVRGLSEDRWNRATFLKAPGDDPSGEGGCLTTLDGRRTRIADEVHAAEAIGRACSLERVTTTALIIGAADASDDEISGTLAQLRPWSLMVVIASTDDYVADMMTALRV